MARAVNRLPRSLGATIAAVDLETLSAEREVVRLVHRYGRAVDAQDLDGIRACYFDDAEEDHAPDFCGPVDDYIDWLGQVMVTGTVMTHQFGNVTVDLQGGDSATVDAYCISTATFPGPSGVPSGWTQLGLRYVDEVRQREGAWRFLRRRCRHLWVIENGKAQAVAGG